MRDVAAISATLRLIRRRVVPDNEAGPYEWRITANLIPTEWNLKKTEASKVTFDGVPVVVVDGVGDVACILFCRKDADGDPSVSGQETENDGGTGC